MVRCNRPALRPIASQDDGRKRLSSARPTESTEALTPPLSSVARTGVGTLTGHPPLLFYLWSRSCSEFSYQIATVAVGWQIYELTGSAFYLGLSGLVQFIPSALLVFAAGHAADRYDEGGSFRSVNLCRPWRPPTSRGAASRGR